MAKRYVARAVEAVYQTLRTKYPAQLRLVEQDEGLAAESLENPIAYVKAPVPYEARTPVIEIYSNDWAWPSQRERNMSVGVMVAVHYLGDADVEAGKTMIGHYVTALLDTLLDNQELDGTVSGIELRGGQPAIERGSDNKTRHIAGQVFDVFFEELPR